MSTATFTDRQMAESVLKDLKSKHSRFVRWFAYCEYVSNACEAATAGIKYDGPNGKWMAARIAAERWAEQSYGKRPAMPSKATKYQMYDDAARLHSLLNLPGDRPHTQDEIKMLINKAEKIIFGR